MPSHTDCVTKIPPVLSEAINDKAEELADFIMDDSSTVTLEGARHKLESWCLNFSGLLADLSPLCNLIKGITFFKDQNIVDRCIQLQKKVIKNDSEIYYSCFGGENESSARIMRILNTNIKFKVHLPEVLELISSDNSCRPCLWFIDDCINSGGQFRRIIEEWFDLHALTSSQISILQKCELHFFFAFGKEEGRILADEILKEKSLNGEIHIIRQYDDKEGCFGNSDDLCKIHNHLDVSLSAGVFKGNNANEIYELLSVCEKAGKQLTLLEESGWDDEKVSNRILGYGNSAQLFINQNNVPTCSLTCLWRGGDVEIDGKRFNWQPLFKRRKKMTGAESAELADAENVKTFNFNNVILDENKSVNAPFEAIIIGEMNCSRSVINNIPLCKMDLSHYYDNDILAELFDADKEHLSIHRLPSVEFSSQNNRLQCAVNRLPDVYRTKICSVDIYASPWSIVYAVRIKIYSCGLRLTDASGMLHTFLVDRSGGRAGTSFYRNKSTETYSVRTLIKNVFEKALPEVQISNTTPRLMAFMRTEEELFKSPSNMRACFAMASAFHNTKLMQRKVAMPKFYFEFNFDGYVSVNERGTLLFCGAGPKMNQDNLQEEFACTYCFNEIISILLNKYAIKKDSSSEKVSESHLYSSMRSFMIYPHTENPHLKKHLELLVKLRGLRYV